MFLHLCGDDASLGDVDLSDVSTVMHYSVGKSRAVSGGCKSKIKLSSVPP